MKVYTAAQMRAREQAAVAAGGSFEQLMECAGTSAAADLLKRLPQAGKCVVLCGKGNNAGDGLVMARLLQAQHWQVAVVWVLGEALSDLAALNRSRLSPAIQQYDALQPDWLRLGPGGVVIDAIFGTGFSGALPPALSQLLAQVNQETDATKVALDIPTGLNGDTGQADVNTFRADITYAFAAYKPAHIQPQAQLYCGEIVCLDIGLD